MNVHPRGGHLRQAYVKPPLPEGNGPCIERLRMLYRNVRNYEQSGALPAAEAKHWYEVITPYAEELKVGAECWRAATSSFWLADQVRVRMDLPFNEWIRSWTGSFGGERPDLRLCAQSSACSISFCCVVCASGFQKTYSYVFVECGLRENCAYNLYLLRK